MLNPKNEEKRNKEIKKTQNEKQKQKQKKTKQKTKTKNKGSSHALEEKSKNKNEKESKKQSKYERIDSLVIWLQVLFSSLFSPQIEEIAF